MKRKIAPNDTNKTFTLFFASFPPKNCLGGPLHKLGLKVFYATKFSSGEKAVEDNGNGAN